ncbi:MAG: hypothetical protein M1839_007450 [Geoglossum umbratile]|nr:MAG: hypothetical protein M1839_007450 [Geoglossum umbratile]
MANEIKISPGIPIPAVFDVQKRIQTLHSYLDPKNPQYQPEQQHSNIQIAIKLYEDGQMDGLEHVYIMDGVVVTQEEAFKGSAWVWSELRMLVRLAPHRGGDGTVHGIIAMNDTGSDILMLFDIDMFFLGNLQSYTG